MNKKLLLSLLLSLSISGHCLGSATSPFEDEIHSQKTNSSLTKLVTENGVKYAKGYAKKVAVNQIKNLITENAPGLAPVIGVVYLYSGSESDKEKYEGTLGKKAGDAFKLFVEELGGEIIVELAEKLKPSDANTLTEALIRACARNYATIRTNEGYSEMLGDAVSAGVKSIPGVGAPIAAAGKTLGQYIDPEANSLTEATLRTTKNYISDAVSLSFVPGDFDDTGCKAQFDALDDEGLKEQIRDKFKSKIEEYNEDIYADYDPYKDMIKMYLELEKANHQSSQNSVQDSDQGSWWGLW